MTQIFKYIMVSIFLLGFICADIHAQITSGKIVYERRTNLFKKYKDNQWAREWIKEEDRNKLDYFELYFNDTTSVFKPQEDDLKDRLSWATSRNSVFQDFKNNKRFTIKSIWGEALYLEDSIQKRTWKITDSKRKIGGYDCRKAIWEANDSTKLYAWYCDEIVVSTGPESFNGLPGAILGLATEDGGVIYFAKTIEVTKPAGTLFVPPKVKKIYTTKELRTKLEKDFGKEKWGKEMIKNTFDIW